jgi:serine protease Do
MKENNSKTARGLLYCSLLCLLLGSRVSAQTGTANRELDPLHQFNTAVRSLVRRVKPSVVQVMVTGYGPVQTGSLASTSVVLGRQESMGSGVIVDSDGYIVTNAHVVMGAHRVQVNVPTTDNVESSEESIAGSRTRTVEARIVGLDAEIDLALLKIEAKGLRPLPIGDYNKVRQGDVVLAFGSPEGL